MAKGDFLWVIGNALYIDALKKLESLFNKNKDILFYKTSSLIQVLYSNTSNHSIQEIYQKI